MYAREAEGLLLLQETQSLRIPKVLAVNEHLLILEWIETSDRARHFDEYLGRGLANLHRATLPTFGLNQNNFLGTLPQINQALPIWHEFYSERRILPLAAMAYEQGTINTALLKRITALCERFDKLCGPSEPVAPLHGDLWSGNVFVDEIGKPVLIDPAVYGGHREVDLAMVCLFGSDNASAQFFAAYNEVYPLDPDYAERIELYQIYPLLAHVCIFGKSYIPSLIAKLDKYDKYVFTPSPVRGRGLG